MFNFISLNMEVFSVSMIKIINTEINALNSSLWSTCGVISASLDGHMALDEKLFPYLDSGLSFLPLSFLCAEHFFAEVWPG